MIRDQEKTLAVFDIDGTLVDPGNKIRYDVEKAIQRVKAGIKVSDHLWKEYGKDWAKLSEQFGVDFEQVRAGLNPPHRETWAESIAKGTVKLYDDVAASLNRVRDSKAYLAALTRSGVPETDQKVHGLGLEVYFPEREIVDVDKKKFPDKREAASRLVERIKGVREVERVYFIGDSEEDVEPAPFISDKFGMPTLGIHLIRKGKQMPTKAETDQYRIVPTLYDAARIILGG